MHESKAHMLRSTPFLDVPLYGVRNRAPAPRSLGELLAAAGAMPQRARGLLHRWFRKESSLLAVANTALSLVVLVVALTMTYIGMRIAQALGLVVPLNEAANAISPYAGAALLSLGTLRLIQNLVLRSDGRVARFLGLSEATLLLLGGLWAEGVAWYTGFIPDILKPQIALAGGAITANVIFIGTVIVPLFKPALATGLGALLTAKQIKTTAVSDKGRPRWYVALIGLLASASTLVIGMDAGQRYLAGKSNPHDVALAQSDVFWSKDFAPPFAPGTWCRVSDIFGPRINPFYFIKPKPPALAQAAIGGGVPVAAPPAPVPAVARIENHPGVDVAARAGTPVHAMVSGEVIYAGFHPGFGNMVVLQAEGSSAATLINGHMQMLFVEPGEMVSRGDLIGLVGSTGHSTGPHLHIQVCPQGHLHKGGFVCGVPRNPYEDWQSLSAIARLACKHGPVGS